MKLVVVESPTKVKTISKYLGNSYKVVATMGHFVDLPKKELGIDTDKDYRPSYVVTNRKALSVIKKAFKDAKELVLATDPDREGEAIGWHVALKLGLIHGDGKLKEGGKLERIIFTSITKDAIKNALQNPQNININLVNAQQARRILDRLVGYKLSPLVWKKVMYGLSAGRVQSVAVRLVVDREEEREAFTVKEYWSIFADVFEKKVKGEIEEFVIENREKEGPPANTTEKGFKGIRFDLVKVNDKKPFIQNKHEALKIVREVKDIPWLVKDIEKKLQNKYPDPPFITSSLQRTAYNKFGYSSKLTMKIAQELYERGYITYMRTDSFNIEEGQLNKIRQYIEKKYGQNYLNPKVMRYKSKVKSAQEAHEAIRPTDISLSSSELNLGEREKKLYDLVRNRTLALQMKPALIEKTTIQVIVGNNLFEARGDKILFDGFLKIYPRRFSQNLLPDIKLNQLLFPGKFFIEQGFTSPPSRYTEATLIRTLEKYGIGRPSTYAPIISTILARKYVVRDGRYLVPTEIGKIVTKMLKNYFSNIVDTGFTAELEKQLDEIANGKVDWRKVVDNFYKPFIKDIEESEKLIENNEFKVVGKSEFKCPVCNKPMIKKIGRFGIFLSCADFPKCKGIRSLDGQTSEEREKEFQKKVDSLEFKKKYLPAPKTKDNKKMVLKKGKFGVFWAHPDYPKIKEIQPLKLREKCPKCGEYLIERQGKWGKIFIGCSGYPKCRFIRKS